MSETQTLVLRSGKVAFYGVTANLTTTFNRMTNFSDLSRSSNPSEYKPKYVDESMERDYITGYSPALAYTFDQFTNNPVHSDIINITDNELKGTDAVRDIVVVDFSTPGTATGSYKASKRAYSVIPDSDGKGTDAYQYVGNFKTAGSKVDGEATTTDEWKTITFTVKSASTPAT